jgi:GNAT superfamily N-acetyltransferase
VAAHRYARTVAESTYWKIPFEWSPAGTLSDQRDPAGIAWRPAADVPDLVQLVGAVLASSVGPEDRVAVEAFGAEAAAERILALAPGFSYRPEWWEVLARDGASAGFVLPVIYEGCRHGDLDEATIYHMGVAREHRGSGLGRLLLRRATRTLLDHGIWRIYCDTPAENPPMIHLFESEGWKRLPAHERPIVVGD